MKHILNELFKHKTLTEEESEQILKDIAEDKFTSSQVASFLTVFGMRGITIEELQGFRKALIDLCLPIDLNYPEIIDMCGTGGDGKDTFNISTLASFVVAGTGTKVAKHGNYGVSSICGSSNVLEVLGIRFTNNEMKLRQQLDMANICILHAPLFHPAMKKVAPIRKELGVQTFFNMLGPMVNPCNPSHQIMGVFSLDLARKYQYIYQQLNKKYVIIHALDGYDEVSLTGNVKLISNTIEVVTSPEKMKFSKTKETDIAGGTTIKESAKVFLKILNGNGTIAQNQVVIANAAIALQCIMNVSFEEAKQIADESLLSGKALKSFNSLINLS